MPSIDNPLALRNMNLDIIKMSANKDGGGDTKDEVEKSETVIEQLRDLLKQIIDIEDFNQPEAVRLLKECRKLVSGYVPSNDEEKNSLAFYSEKLQLKSKALKFSWNEVGENNEYGGGQEKINVNREPSQKDLIKRAKEISEILARVIYTTDDTQNLQNELIALKEKIRDPLEVAHLSVVIMMQDIAVRGDAGKNDYSVWFNDVIRAYGNRTVGLMDTIRAFFLKKPEEGYFEENDSEGVLKEKLDKLEINMNAVEVWDYIVARIKGKKKYGGIERNGSDPTDRDFSYNELKNDNINLFREHLRHKFPTIDPNLLNELIKFAQYHDVKTVGYIPWLANETTRSHGTAIAAFKNEKLSDALFTCAPLAAGVYARGRYGSILPLPNSSDLIYFSPGLYESLIQGGAFKKSEKEKAATDLYNIVNHWYRVIAWNGKTPGWVEEMRKKVGVKETDDLSIYESWFPLPGELIIDALKTENARRTLTKKLEAISDNGSVDGIVSDLARVLKEEGIKFNIADLKLSVTKAIKRKARARIGATAKEASLRARNSNPEAFAAAIREYYKIDANATEDQLNEARKKAVDCVRDVAKIAFVEQYSALGYAAVKVDVDIKDGDAHDEAYAAACMKVYDSIGFGVFEGATDIGTYNLAFEAVTQMNEFFYEKLGDLTKQQAIEKFQTWVGSYIGKAKLIPGRHHHTFVPQTLRAMDKIINAYEGSSDERLVKDLLSYMKNVSIGGGDGLPRLVQEQVYAYLEEDDSYFGMRQSLIGWPKYIEALYAYKNRLTEDPVVKMRMLVPGTFGKVDDDGTPLRANRPWNWKLKTDKDTTK